MAGFNLKRPEATADPENAADKIDLDRTVELRVKNSKPTAVDQRARWAGTTIKSLSMLRAGDNLGKIIFSVFENRSSP
jgi:hypothetical protein